MADISKIKLPDGTTRDIKDANASTIKNLLDGSANNSLRSVGSVEESASYTIGTNAVALGNKTQASGNSATALGSESVATSDNAVAIGAKATASGNSSYAIGENTIANHRDQFVFGKFNVADTNASAATAIGDYAEIVGNGTADNARSNARTLDWDGNEVLAGKLTVGAAPTNNMDVATKQYVDSKADTKTWGDVALGSSRADTSDTRYIVQFNATSNVNATTSFVVCRPTPFALGIPKWDNHSYLYSGTPSANDNSTKVATTAYVDAAIPDVSGYVSKSGDTMTGRLTLNYNGSSDGLLFKYSDSYKALIRASGGSYSGADAIAILSLTTNDTSNGVILRGVATPDLDTAAANKKYVDDNIPKVYSSTNTGGYLTMATLPIYDGTVV